MIEQVVNSVDPNLVMGWAKENQGAIGIFGWAILLIYALGRVVKSKFGGEFDMGRIGNTLQVALSSNTGWRWGEAKGEPTGKSIVMERDNGDRLAANFKTGKYFLYTKESKMAANGDKKVSTKENELNGLLSKKQIKKLNALRDKIVASIKASDAAEAKATKQRKDDEVVAQLNRFNSRF